MPHLRIIFVSLCCLALSSPAFAQGSHVKGPKPLSIAQGREVLLKDFYVSGFTTVFVFTSEYNALCRSYADPLLVLHERYNDLAVVKVDINRPEIHQIDWDSPVAQQYAIKSVPHFLVYDPQGKVIAEGDDARRQVDRLIEAIY